MTVYNLVGFKHNTGKSKTGNNYDFWTLALTYEDPLAGFAGKLAFQLNVNADKLPNAREILKVGEKLYIEFGMRSTANYIDIRSISLAH